MRSEGTEVATTQSLVFMSLQVFLNTIKARDLHHSKGSAVRGMSCSDKNPLISNVASVTGFWTPGLRLVTRYVLKQYVGSRTGSKLQLIRCLKK